MSALPLPLKGRSHLLAARFARLEGRWDTVRQEATLALNCGVPAGEALRLMPRAAANEDVSAAQGELKVRKLLAGRPIRRLKTPQLRGVLDVALQHQLSDVASEVLSTIAARSTMPPQARFDAAVLAVGVASDESVLSVFDDLRGLRPFRVSATYHHARALERLGRNEEARAEYHQVVDLDDGATRYYGIWAEARLTGFEQMASGTCRRDATGACLPDTGLQLPAAMTANPQGDALPNLAAFPGLSTVFGEQPSARPDSKSAKRENIVARLASLASTHGAGYPWFARAADLAELELYDDAASEIGEAYLAWRDARGGLRVRAGVEAVLTNSAPPRHLATGPVRRDRLALDSAARLALADVADMLDEPGIAVRLRDQRGEPRPRAYAEDVEKAAAKYGIDPNLLFAVMRVESVYYRHIVSFAGAVGLMQIMPRTGMRIARALGVQGFDTLDLLDPRKNLEFAAWYLSSLIQRFDGRLPLAIASYNGGPHNVRLWLSQHPSSMPLDAFLERIPFTETHRYVRRVLTHYAAYRAQQNLPMPNLAISLPKLAPDSIAF
jgi:soluble lytic murein transglycosylase